MNDSVKGIGVDLIEVERVKEAMKSQRFLEKYFSAAERDFFSKLSNPAKSVSTNFAAKEAFAKALGIGIRGFKLREVEVLRDDLGKPYINLYGGAKNISEGMGITDIFVSLSNSKENAVAFVIVSGIS